MSHKSTKSIGDCVVCSGSGKQGIFGQRGLGIVGRVCGNCGGSGNIQDLSYQVLDPGEFQRGFFPGAIVRIHGIKTKVELNGQEAVLQELVDRDLGLWYVKLANGKTKQIGARNLELPGTSINMDLSALALSVSTASRNDSAQPARSISNEDVAQPEFTVTQGMRVRLHSIKGLPEMNGQIGIFERFHEGRCVVRLDEGSKMFFPANLQPVGFNPPASSQNFVAADISRALVANSNLDEVPASVASPDAVVVPLPADLLRASARGRLGSALSVLDLAPARGRFDSVFSVPDFDPAPARGRLDSVLSVPDSDATPAPKCSAADLLKSAARGSLNSALQRRPRDERTMRSAWKLAERANLSEAELLPMTEALAAETRKAALLALEAALAVPVNVDPAIAEGQAAGLKDREIKVAQRELPPEGPTGDLEGSAGSPRDQKFDVVD